MNKPEVKIRIGQTMLLEVMAVIYILSLAAFALQCRVV